MRSRVGARLNREERREAHARRWQKRLEGAAQAGAFAGSLLVAPLLRAPNPNVVVANVDLVAGLRLASERGHDEAYPRPDEVEADEE